MATQEEIIQQYQEDRNRKLLQLQTTLSSRIAQTAKQSAAIVNGVSIISTTTVSDDIFGKDRILNYQNGKDTKFSNDLRNEFVAKNSTPSEPFVYLTIFPLISYLSENSFNVTISQVLYFRDTGTDENIENARSAPKKIETESFGDLNKELSAYSFPLELIWVSDRYKKYLDVINTKLKSSGLNTIFESFPVLVYSQILIPDGTQTNQFSTVFPKPDGYILTPTLPSTPNISDASGTLPSVPGVELPSTPSLPNAQQIPSNVPPLETVDKYLSIEAIKDDDPIVETEASGSDVISLRFIDDKEINDYYSSNQLRGVTTKTAEVKQNQPPIKPSGDKNSTVVKNESKNTKTKTDAQKRLEDSDSIQKEKPKKKSSTSPSGGNPNLSDGKEADKDEKTDVINKKQPDAITKNEKVIAKTFLEWHKSDGRDPNGIIYRGNIDKRYNGTVDSVNITEGLVESRYKNLFDFGTNLNKLFGNLKFESPIDVGLALNGIQVGLFNKNIPYTFVEGSEVQSALIPKDTVVREKEGGIGTVNNNANWGNEPYWCGYFTNFVLFNNGRYKSDASLKNIAGTSSVKTYYDASPFNSKVSESVNSEIKTIQTDITELKKQKKSLQEQLSKKKKVEEETGKKLKKYLDNTGTTEQDQNKLSQLQANYKKAAGESASVQKAIDSVDVKINEKESSLRSKQNSNQQFKEDGNVAVFQYGYHISSDGSLTARGIELWERIKKWPGAYIVTTGGHVEVLLHFSKSGKLYTLGGNTGITLIGPTAGEIKKRANPSLEKPGTVDRNGYQYGFKRSSSPGGWAGSGNDLYVVKRGTSKPYTKGIGIGLLKTTLWRQYESLINAGTDPTISPMAYNIISGIFVD